MLSRCVSWPRGACAPNAFGARSARDSRVAVRHAKRRKDSRGARSRATKLPQRPRLPRVMQKLDCANHAVNLVIVYIVSHVIGLRFLNDMFTIVMFLRMGGHFVRVASAARSCVRDPGRGAKWSPISVQHDSPFLHCTFAIASGQFWCAQRYPFPLATVRQFACSCRGLILFATQKPLAGWVVPPS